MEFNEELDCNADIETYKRSRTRIQQSDMESSRKAALIANCDYAITWLETGRRPGNKRGVERLAAYQREMPTDIIERYMKPTPQLVVQTDERMLQEFMHMEYILSLLSDRERECYELHVGGMHTEYEIAELLNIKRATVQEFLRRAEAKIKKYKSQPVPLLLVI